jgi:two-component system, NtrC family, sensor histidine kinase GlrK
VYYTGYCEIFTLKNCPRNLQITYPKSFLKLLLIGFTLAILPLLVTFVSANIYFDKLTKQSLFNMSQAVETTRASRILLEELAIMERSARQYFVLHDKLLLTQYFNAHTRLKKTLNSFSALPMARPLLPALEQFSAQENSLFLSITQTSTVFNFDESITNTFATLSTKANQLINENNQLIDQQSALFTAKVAHTQKILFWQMLTLFPLAIIIAGLITWMLARPIRRMDAAIHQLGRGNYEQPIAINGPGNLRQLGARLDWLRVALKDLHQQKQLFLQQASHELKTPLTAIREASELMNDGVAGSLNPQQSEIMLILRDNSLRLQKMIENLLNYTEFQFNSSKLNIAQMALDTLLIEILQSYKLTISQKNIKINQQVEDIFLRMDIEKLRTVLDNLISNAVKFTPENSEIHIKAVQSKSNIFIEIHDSGPGISEQNKSRLFDPFCRGDEPNKSLLTGSGLGLFIAREAANSLKGELTLVPANIGAHFLLSLPR